MGIHEILDHLEKVGYKDMTVAELIKQLAGLPPMMPIFAVEGGNVDSLPNLLWFNGLSIREEDKPGQPVLLLHVAREAEARIDINAKDTPEEQEAKKKDQAFEMARESEESTRILP